MWTHQKYYKGKLFPSTITTWKVITKIIWGKFPYHVSWKFTEPWNFLRRPQSWCNFLSDCLCCWRRLIFVLLTCQIGLCSINQMLTVRSCLQAILPPFSQPQNKTLSSSLSKDIYLSFKIYVHIPYHECFLNHMHKD